MPSERRKKRKRRDSDDEEEESPLSNWKLGMIVAVVVICFAMLYPTVLHPLLMGTFSRSDAPKPTQSRPPMHPGMGARANGGPGGAHPAMRMAASHAETASQQSGGGRGMYSWLLPFYTIGVVVFLLYTLFKSKSKKKKSRRSRYGSESEESDEDYVKGLGGGKDKKKVRGLQKRLRETEDAMSKILEQLERVQGEGLALAEQEDEAADGKKKPSTSKADAQKPSTSKGADPDAYIDDLERALAEFKILSQQYDKAKIQKAKGGRRAEESEPEDDEEDEVDDVEGEEDEEEEEDEQEASTSEGERDSEKSDEHSEVEDQPPAEDEHPETEPDEPTPAPKLPEPPKVSIIPPRKTDEKVRRRKQRKD
ncbi:unnamed protein product, partial [Mesorhabditis spiculigera]